jgi:hypothetical protein
LRFKEVVVDGHPRTGNHLLLAVIALNFFHIKKYREYKSWHRGHEIPPDDWKPRENYGYVIAHRNLNDTLLSLFKIQRRFHLKCNDFIEFCNTPYVQMWRDADENPVTTYVDAGGFKSENGGYARNFRYETRTPIEFFTAYYARWREIFEEYGDQVHKVYYEYLVHDTQLELGILARFLGSDKREFDFISHKIGWLP